MNKNNLFLKTLSLVLLINVGCSNKAKVNGQKVITSKRIVSAHKLVQGEVSFTSSDPNLVKAFTWAKEKALSYTHPAGDPVGLWYEAALPEREAFCMRDISHHSTGAQILGLQNHTLNMMSKFAENISESKDWCTYWEINRYNKPAPADYKSDKEFWYNLPANFDVLDACYRQYLWSGDETYIKDATFLNFYSKSMNEYIAHWNLELDRIMQRERYMHVQKPLDRSKAFQLSRGLPSYGEGAAGELFLGGDLLAAQYAGYEAYANILMLNGNTEEATKFKNHAKALKDFFNADWWNEAAGLYNTELYTDGQELTSGEVYYLPYFGITEDGEKTNNTVQHLIKTGDHRNVESRSFLPEVYYNYGENKAAYNSIMSITNENNSRRNYPEVSFATVGNITIGTMGINPNSVTKEIITLSNLTDDTEWAEIKNVPVFNGKIDVKHEGNIKTTITNVSKEDVVWVASFAGTHDSIDVAGERKTAIQTKVLNQQIVSIIKVTVKAGEKITAQLK